MTYRESMWKPKDQKFTDEDYKALSDKFQHQTIAFLLDPMNRNGVEGHLLTAVPEWEIN